MNRQLKSASDYANKNGLILSQQGYSDLGISAYTGKNLEEGSELRALIQAIEDGVISKGSTLIIENLDRLSRQFITTSLPFFIRILNAGIRVVTLSDGKAYDKKSVDKNPYDLMFSIMVLSRANEESEIKKTRISAAWRTAQKNAETNKIKTSYPSWLELENNSFRVISSKAKLVVRIYRDYLEGNSTGKIARILNSEGSKTFTGKSWVQTTVKYLLKNPSVIGEYHAGKREKGKKIKTGQIIKDYFPAIIDENDYFRVQAKFRLNPSKIGRPQREDANLFTGLIKCPYCGGSMGVNGATKSRSFICWNSVNGGCVRAAIPIDFVELAVLTSTESIAKSMAATVQDSEKIERIEGEIGQIKRKVSNLVQLVADGSEIEEVRLLLRKLKQEQNEKETELKREIAVDEIKKLETDNTLTSLISGHLTDANKRLALIPHIRRYVAKVETYFLGDAYEQYRKELKKRTSKRKNGGTVYHELRAKFKIEHIQYVKVHFHIPIVIDGIESSVWICRRSSGGSGSFV